MQASIDSLETFGLVDGPGIRTIVFFNGCTLRCKYCHNPEMWNMKEKNYTVEELVEKVKRYKNYYGNKGGVTLSGGEPLLHGNFIIELCKRLKEEEINVALDTSGVGIGNYENILENIEYVLLDIKHIDKDEYYKLTSYPMEEVKKFIEVLNKLNKKVWIRQVIIPGLTDNLEYVKDLKEYLKQIDNIERVDFLPYHKLGDEKYTKLKIDNPYKDKETMDINKCKELYEEFKQLS